MRREYYLHKRKNGIFYVEYVNPENGEKLSARSTGETDKIKPRSRRSCGNKAAYLQGE